MGKLSEALAALFTKNTTTAATASGAHVPVTDAEGNILGSAPMADAGAAMAKACTSGGVLVAYRDETSSGSKLIYFCQLSQLTAARAAKAIGPAIYEGGRFIIVAKQGGEAMNWGTYTGAAYGTVYGAAAREQAFGDFTGRARQQAIMAHAQASAALAAQYCAQYYPTGVTGVDASDTLAGQGRWWLPSQGELLTIWAHYHEVNRVLEAIGGETLPAAAHWSSTENSATSAWAVHFSSGLVASSSKASYSARVRAVSAYY